MQESTHWVLSYAVWLTQEPDLTSSALDHVSVCLNFSNLFVHENLTLFWGNVHVFHRVK